MAKQDYLDKMIASRGPRFAAKVERALARREFDRKAQQMRDNGSPWIPFSKRFGRPRLSP